MYREEKAGKRSLGATVERELMKYILTQPVLVGQKIPNEYELAEMFDVGRGTIREAVKGLVSKKILEVRRGNGTYVVNTSTVEDDPLGLGKLGDKFELALELFEARLVLEPEIAAFASMRITAEEKVRLKELCDEVEAIYRRGENHIYKDVEFHTYIAKCSKNRVFEKMIPVIQTAVVTFANLTYRQLFHETIETHRLITDAIIKGDAVGARCAMIMHLSYNRQMLMGLYEERNKKQEKNESVEG